jgi:small subunit ribosomal protein S20
MASHKSAEKCIRKIARRTAINKSRMSRIRTFIRRADETLSQSVDHAERVQVAVSAEREIMRGVRKGVIHRNKAARQVSKLARRAAAMS